MEKELVEAFNEQIKNELYSAYLYLAMAAWAESENFPGTAHWLKEQAKEEVEHAMKMFDFLNDRGEKVLLHAIDRPGQDFSSVEDVFENTLAHEQKVTGLIHRLYELAGKHNDHAAEIFLQWFVSEQVEEEATASSILETVRQVKPGSGALIVLDRQLGQRKS
ncbi:MAG: ferritin [Candidatus Omnitrophica bacterium]|nr:ferritin [Candidatus Omnitrophota bacterium]